MPKLNQIIALEKGVRTRTQADVMAIFRMLQNLPKFSGLVRTYQPKDDEGDTLPSEGTQLQLRAVDLLQSITDKMTELLDLTLVKDNANTLARADIIVDGNTIATDVPVTYLLFLEKQLQDLGAIIKGLPLLDSSEKWTWDPSLDCYRSDPVQTTRTKKIPRNHVKAEATAHHPAQVEIYYEDVHMGTWTQVKHSGALPRDRVRQLQERLTKLSDAVKVARETANLEPVGNQKIAEQIFLYLFAN